MIDFLTTPLDTDLAYGWIKALFPTDSSQPYGQAFAIFTSALTFLGALFMGWHIIMGIVTSAYSGKVLGERYHQIWAPLRVVLGFGMLVPIAGGFSTVHYLLRDVVGVAAIQMANIPIVTYINGMATQPPGLSAVSMQGGAMADRVISLQACAANVVGVNEVVGPWVLVANADPMPAMARRGSGYYWSYGDCGSIFLNTPEYDGEFANASKERILQFANKRAEATQQLMSDLRPLIDHKQFGEYFARKKFDEEEVGSRHAEEIRKARIISDRFAEGMDEAADKWNEAVSEAASEIFSESSVSMRANLMKRIVENGFMVAGSYERTLSQLSSMAISIAGDEPVTVVGSPGMRYKDAYLGGQAAVKAVRQLNARTSGLGDTPAFEDGATDLELVYEAIRPMMRTPKIDNADPVGSMIAFGHSLVAGAQVGIITMIAAHSFGEGTSNSLLGWVGLGAVGGAINYLSQWVGYVIVIALLVGILHAFVLPMIPMIMVFVMGVSWLVLFLEAAIAGVLWAFAFIRMDGQDFFDRNQAPGITLLFNLFLRPAIGMLAFIGGLILIPVMLNGLAVIWNDSFSVQTEGLGFNVIVAWIVGLIMHAWMMWHLYLRVWGLVPTIADRVGHWMGFQMHGYNDGQETQAATGAMIAAGAAIGKAPLLPQGGKAAARGSNPNASKGDVANMAGNKSDPGKSRSTTPRR